MRLNLAMFSILLAALEQLAGAFRSFRKGDWLGLDRSSVNFITTLGYN